jgi:hypothetical protein
MVHSEASTSVGASDARFHAIPQLDQELCGIIRSQLFEAREYCLEYAWSSGSQAGRERAVRYWRIFCSLLGLPEVISSHQDSWQLQYFAAFMGLVWKKTDGTSGLAGTTVEQQISQVRVWLSEEFGIRVLAFDALTSKVVKGLKRRRKTALGMMHTPEVTYRFKQRFWESQNTTMSRLHQDMDSMRFLMLRRISEMAATQGHNDRYLLDCNVTFEGSIKVWCFWPITKNSRNLSRAIDATCSSFFHRMVRRSEENKKFLALNPQFDEKRLPFFHLSGRPIHRREIEKEVKCVMALAFAQEPAVGHLDPALYRYNTHSDRKGGAIWMLDTIRGSEFYVRYMGDWKSLAFYLYGRVSRKSAALIEHSLSNALNSLFSS